MGKIRHAEVVNHALIDATRRGWRLFRNSAGLAWHGIAIKERSMAAAGRIVVLHHARRLPYGLKVGSSDLIGLRTVTITSDMVGTKIAQFVSVECKTNSYRMCTEDQKTWLTFVRRAGGYAAVGRLVEGEIEFEEAYDDGRSVGN